MTEREKLVHNETTKLRANAVNTVATYALTAGVVSPILSMLASSPSTSQRLIILAAGAFSGIVAFGLYWVAGALLKGLE